MRKSVMKALEHDNVLGAGAAKRKHLSPKNKRLAVMEEFRRGTLYSSDGKIVTDPKQAVAIAYSESRRKG